MSPLPADVVQGLGAGQPGALALLPYEEAFGSKEPMLLRTGSSGRNYSAAELAALLSDAGDAQGVSALNDTSVCVCGDVLAVGCSIIDGAAAMLRTGALNTLGTHAPHTCPPATHMHMHRTQAALFPTSHTASTLTAAPLELPVHCIYGSGSPTTRSWALEGPLRPPRGRPPVLRVASRGRGDGIVNLESLRLCSRWVWWGDSGPLYTTVWMYLSIVFLNVHCLVEFK